MAFRIGIGKRFHRGFTLVELLVVMAIIATLLALAAPRYSKVEEKARVAALKSNLRTLREAIDHFHGDRGEYPQTLQELVQHRYLRAIPADPLLGHAEAWTLIPVPADAVPPIQGNPPVQAGSAINATTTLPPGALLPAPPRPGGIYDVRSSAEGTAPDGTSYASY